MQNNCLNLLIETPLKKNWVKAGEIKFDSVSLSYDEQKDVLKNLNFTINSREKIVIKSVLTINRQQLRIILRLVNPWFWSIPYRESLDEQELERVQSLRLYSD